MARPYTTLTLSRTLALPIIYRYTDLWCNTTVAAAEGGRGPHSCRALLLRMDVEMEDGSTFVLQTKAGAGAGAGAGVGGHGGEHGTEHGGEHGAEHGGGGS